MDGVIKNYTRTGLEGVILDALRGVYGDLEGLGPDALASVDEFHVRGRESTVELAELVDTLAGRSVLDVGCGLGGTSRYLAARHGCRVTGLDLTPAYVDLARTLSALVGLDGATSFQEGSATDLPFDDASFDVV